MALEREDLATLQLAFGDHDEPERLVTSMVGSVIKSAAASVDAMVGVYVELADRWNGSAELLDRVEVGVDRLRRSAERYTTVLAEVRRSALLVMQALAQSAQEAGDGLE